MKNINLSHPLLNKREDLLQWTMNLLNPVKPYFIQHHTRLNLEHFSSGAPDDVSRIEGFSRLIWAITAISELGPNDPWWQDIREGLIHGCDPDDPDYFGDIEDYDQRIVETAAIGYAFVLRPECIYNPLSSVEKENLIAWLDQVNHRKAYECNWKFFRIMVNIGFKSLGLPWNKEACELYLNDMEAYYVGDGWYKDGHPDHAHTDYYVPFAMHYYGLFYAMHMEDVDPKRCQIYRDRARLFADDFIHWFEADGSALPYGRSLTYRFAQAAFWSMMVVSGNECSYSLGTLKGIILRHLRWWDSQAISDSRGILTIGYAYPNHYMAENYNAPGSVYWSMKTMILLTLPEDHPFWTTKEEAYPVCEQPIIQKTPKLIFYHDPMGKQLLAYNGGSKHSNGHTHVECKYEKFVYSTYFGFSVPKSHKTLHSGAFDSTLAVSEDGSYYRHKDKSKEIHMKKDSIITLWAPFKDVTIRTMLIVGYPWHIRIHKVKSARPLQVAEGGFAIENSQNMCKNSDKDSAIISSNKDFSAIQNISNFDHADIINPAPNTNIMVSRTLIPSLIAQLEPGEHLLISMVYGGPGNLEDCILPDISLEEAAITIIHEQASSTYSLDFM